MKTTQAHAKMVEWLSADDMHEASKLWLSELRFAKDEYAFFDDLVKSYTLQLIDTKHFPESQKIIDGLIKIEKKTDLLIEAIKTHENELEIMVDAINQPKEEEAYKREHRNLIVIMSEFQKEYRTFKTKLFKLIKTVIKEGKQKRLLE